MQMQLDELAFQFFKLFAQYESTLKERGFFRRGIRGEVLVNWDQFANEVVGPNFRNDLGDAADYILQNPPMKQSVNQDGQIIWVEVPNNDQSAQALIAHICRIRNNLYHGAKFNGTWFDPNRSHELLRGGLAILGHYSHWLGH